MEFFKTDLAGAYIIEPGNICDVRGHFARTYCKNTFSKMGISRDIVQCNVSFNRKKGTLRGMHYQQKPYEEAKLVRCTRGAIFDVIIDLRPDSDTFRQWISIELNENNGRLLYIPEGFAHGFQTLRDETEVFYEMFENYQPEYSAGIRWNDPAFGIAWPDNNMIISDKDMNYPDYTYE